MTHEDLNVKSQCKCSFQLGSALADRGFTNVTLRWSQNHKRVIQKVDASKSESVLATV